MAREDAHQLVAIHHGQAVDLHAAVKQCAVLQAQEPEAPNVSSAAKLTGHDKQLCRLRPWQEPRAASRRQASRGPVHVRLQLT